LDINTIIRTHCISGSKILGIGGPSRHLYKLNIQSVEIYDLNIKDRDYNRKHSGGKKRYSSCFIIGDIMSAPFDDNMFDVCFSSNTFEHISEPWRAAEECVRVTKQNGIILHFAPFAWKHHDQPDYYRYSPEGFTYLFERTGRIRTVECKMMRINKKKKSGWEEYWRTVYYGIKK